MPATTLRASQNTYGTSVTGGTVPDANRIIDVSTWARAVEPTKTPILQALGAPITKNQRPFYFGRSQFPAHKSILAANIANNATTLTVATGDGVLFQGNSAFVIYDAIPGSNPARYDYSTKEIFWVPPSGVSGDTLTVTRGQGSTTAIAHTAGALIEILPPHEPQLQDHTISPVTRGFQDFNHFSRIAGGVKMDAAFRKMPTWEFKGDQLINDMKTEQVRLRLLLEKLVIHGGRQAGNPSTPLPEMMNGVLSCIITNIYNQAGATLSVASLETAVRDLWNSVDDSMAKRLLLSMNTAAVFDTFLNPYRQATMGDTQATYFLDRIKLRSGVYDIAVSRWMPDGVIAIVDFTNMKLVAFEGLDWHTLDHPVNGDYFWRSMSGDFSLQVQNEKTMGLIINFNTDLDQYAGRQFLA